MGKRKEKAKGRLRRFVKRCALWALGLAAILLVVLAGVRLYLTDARLRRMVIDHVQRASGCDVQLPRLRLRLRSGLVIEGLRLSETRLPKRPVVLSLDKLSVGYGMARWWPPALYFKHRIEGLNLRNRLAPDDPAQFAFDHLAVGIELSRLLPPVLEVKAIELSGPRVYVGPAPERSRGPIPWPLTLVLSMTGQFVPGMDQGAAFADVLRATRRVVLPMATRPEPDATWVVELAARLALEAVSLSDDARRVAEPIVTAPALVAPMDWAPPPEPSEGVPAVVETLCDLLPTVRFALGRLEVVDAQALIKRGEAEPVPVRAPRLTLAFEATLTPGERRFDLDALCLRVGDRSGIDLHASVSQWSTAQAVDLDMSRCAFDLGELFAGAKSLVPGMKVSGEVALPEFRAKGTLAGQDPLAATLTAEVRDLSVSCPEPKIDVQALNVTVDLRDVKVAELFPASARAAVRLHLPRGTFDTLSVAEVTQEIVLAAADMAQQGDTIVVNRASVRHDLRVGEVKLSDPLLGLAVRGAGVAMAADVGRVGHSPQRSRLARASASVTLTVAAAQVQQAGSALTATVSGLALHAGAGVRGVEVRGADVTVAGARADQSFQLQSAAAALSSTAVALGPVEQDFAAGVGQVGLAAGKLGAVTTTVSTVSVSAGVALTGATVSDGDVRLVAGGIAATLSTGAGDIVQAKDGVSAGRASVDVEASLRRADAGRKDKAAAVRRVVVAASVQTSRFTQTGSAIGLGRCRVRQSVGVANVQATAPNATATVGPIDEHVDVAVHGVDVQDAGAETMTVRLDVLSLDMSASVGPVQAVTGTTAATVTGLSQQLTVRGRRIARTPEHLSLGELSGDLGVAVRGVAARTPEVTAAIDEIAQGLRFEAAGEDLQVCDAFVSLKMPHITARHRDLGEFSTDLSLSLEAKANVAEERVSSLSLGLGVGDLLSVSVRGRADGFGRESLSAKTRLTLDLKEVSRLITPELRREVGDLDLGGSVGLSVMAQGKLSQGYQPDPVNVALDLTMRIKPAKYGCVSKAKPAAGAADEEAEEGAEQPPLGVLTRGELDWLVLDVKASTSYSDPLTVGPTSVSCDIGLRNLQATQRTMAAGEDGKPAAAATPTVAAELGEMDFKFSLDVPRAFTLTAGPAATATPPASGAAATPTPLPDLTAHVAIEKFTIQAAKLRYGDMETQPTDLSVTLSATGDTGSGAYTLHALRVDLSNYLGLVVRGAFSQPDLAFHASVQERLNLGLALRQAPQAVRPATTITTNLVQRLYVNAEGRVPSEADIAALHLPVAVEAKLTLRGDVELPEFGVDVAGLDEATTLTLTAFDPAAAEPERANVVTLDQRLSIRDVRVATLTRWLAIEPEMRLHAALTDFDEFSLRLDSQLNPDVRLGLSAAMDGLRTIVEGRGKANMHDVLGAANASARIDVSAQNLDKLSDGAMTVAGDFRLGMEAGLLAGRSAFARLRLGVQDMSFDQPDVIRIDRVQSHIALDIGKDIELVQAFTGSARTQSNLSETFLGKVERLLAARSRSTARALYGDLRTFGPSRESLRIERVAAQNYRVEDFALDLNFDRGVWIDHVNMTVLGGTVAARFGAGILDEEYVMGMALEFTGLNGKSLLPMLDEGVSDKDAEISGNFMVAVRLGTEKELGLDDMHMSINITKVGRKAFDRFLLAQDPTESDPNIVTLRRYIALGGTLAKLSIRVVNGEMRQDIRWKPPLGPVIALPLPESVPLGKVMDLSLFEGPLKALSQVQKLLRILAATKVKVDRAGGVAFE